MWLSRLHERIGVPQVSMDLWVSHIHKDECISFVMTLLIICFVIQLIFMLMYLVIFWCSCHMIIWMFLLMHPILYSCWFDPFDIWFYFFLYEISELFDVQKCALVISWTHVCMWWYDLMDIVAVDINIYVND